MFHLRSQDDSKVHQCSITFVRLQQLNLKCTYLKIHSRLSDFNSVHAGEGDIGIV